MSEEQPDGVLVERALRGDKEAFGELVLRYRRPVLAIAYRMTGDPARAEDLAQEAFLRAWTRLAALRDGAAFKGWLYRLAVNACLDHLRRAPREAPLADDQPAPNLPEGQALARERAQLVRKAVLSLPPECRAALILREFEGLAYKEIAAALDIPLGTVMSRLSYARNLLRVALRVYLGTPAGSGEE